VTVTVYEPAVRPVNTGDVWVGPPEIIYVYGVPPPVTAPAVTVPSVSPQVSSVVVAGAIDIVLFTVTTTTSVLVHVPLVTVTVYEVVPAGEAVGFAVVVLLNPAAGLQEYVPPPVAESVVELPLQMTTSVPAFATGEGVTVIVTVDVAVHPDALVTVTV
jgi:hypothetical protein